MARKRSASGDASTTTHAPPPAASAWSALTWSDLEEWTGTRTIERGRSYQRGGRVSKLAITADGTLLADVSGTRRYATRVAIGGGRGAAGLESACTCPVGVSCKHAVAVVAEYLQTIAEGRDVPTAADSDPRLARIAAAESWDEFDDEGWDGDEDEEDDEGEPRAPAPRRGRAPAAPGADAQVEAHLRGLSREELADLACEWARRHPAFREELRERLALRQGDAKRLIAEACREIDRATAEPGWSNHWSGEGHLPDYGKVTSRLQRLLELGRADDVVTLGRVFLDRGLQQVASSHDEGETGMAFGEALEVVFEAVSRSSLSPPERLLLAIDAALQDDTDVTDAATAPVLGASYRPEDWSAVADALAARLASQPVEPSGPGTFSRDYERDRLARWVAEALEGAGRTDEVTALYEAEARGTRSYERLVSHLIEIGRDEDAEHWAREGIAATQKDLPGIAQHLAARLAELAASRGRWDVVAAQAAHQFFDEHPGVGTFDKLIDAASRAGVEAPVRAAALRFLETGHKPYRMVTPRPKAAAAKKPAAKGTGKAAAKGMGKATAKVAARPVLDAGPGGTRVEIDGDWPLPVPDELIPMLERPTWGDGTARPHLGVLLELALAGRRPDEALAWYDRMREADAKARDRHGYGYGYGGAASYADRVAAAVAATHPERALAILTQGLEAQLPQASPSAYEAAAGYLKKLRPLYEALGRADEWPTLVAAIRERYRNRPRFMEVLDRLQGGPRRTILEEARGRKR